MCRTSVEGVRHFDNSGMIEALDLHNPEARAQFPELALEALLEELHAVDDRGQVYRGARAINQILRMQSGVRGLLAYLWYVPGYAWLADRQYKRIAASRYNRDAQGRLRKASTSQH
jgi:predicted DCC family thiol-disulfide oxidoreductase YuxK